MTDQQIDPDRSALVAPAAAISVIPSAPSFASAARQSQDALRNDVAHDLVGAARDRPAIAFQEIVHAQAAAVPGPGIAGCHFRASLPSARSMTSLDRCRNGPQNSLRSVGIGRTA